MQKGWSTIHMKHKAAYSVDLQIPPEEAWDKLSDLSLAPCYVPGVKSMEFITREKKGVGAARIVYPQNMKEVVLDWIPGSEILLGLYKKGKERFFPFKKSVFRYRLSLTGGTYMNLSLEYEPILGEVGYLLFGGIIRKRIIKTAENLKEFYEKQ